MKVKLLLLLLVGSVAGNVAFAVTTYLARHSPPATQANDRLGLDQNQRAKLAPLQERFAVERAQSRSRVSELTELYAAQFARAEPDLARVEQFAAEMATIQTGMRMKFMRFLLDMHALLRPDQRVVLSDIIRNKGAPDGAFAPCCPGAALCPGDRKLPGEDAGACSSTTNSVCTQPGHAE